MRLTHEFLKKIVKEEMSKVAPLAKAEEVDADELADALEKKIDYIKALKIEESRLSGRLNRIKSQHAKTISEIKSNPSFRRKIIAENEKRNKEAAPVISQIQKLMVLGGPTGDYLKDLLGAVGNFADGGFNWKGLFSLGMADTPIEKAKGFVDGLNAGIAAVGNSLRKYGKGFLDTQYETFSEALEDIRKDQGQLFKVFESAWKSSGKVDSDLPPDAAFQDFIELSFSEAKSLFQGSAPKASLSRQMSRKSSRE